MYLSYSYGTILNTIQSSPPSLSGSKKVILEVILSDFKDLQLFYYFVAAGGVHNAIDNALKCNAQSFALFLRNQRSWNAKPMDPQVNISLKIKIILDTFTLLSQAPKEGDFLKITFQ